MRLRTPSPRPFSVLLGVFAGATVLLLVPPVLDDAAFSTTSGLSGVAVLCGLFAWSLAEQVPDLLDAAVRNRLHYALGVLSALPLLTLLALRQFGGTDLRPEPLVPPVVAFVVVGLLVVGSGSSRVATLVRSAEPIQGLVSARVPFRWWAAKTFVGSTLGFAALGLVFGGAFSVAGIVGSLVGVCIGRAFTGRKSMTLEAYESGLVVGDDVGVLDGNVVPWRRVSAVEYDGTTLRIKLRLPWLAVYEADLSSYENAPELVDSFRRCRR